MTGPGALEWELSLRSAVARFDELRVSEAVTEEPEPAAGARETLELLTLSEVIARKAVHGRQLTVRNARAAGASWADIGRSLGVSRQSAWEAHARWIDVQEAQHRAAGTEGLDADQVAQARYRAGAASS